MIITSLLDLDLYKLTVGQVIFTHFRKVKATYQMKVRNGNAINYWNIIGPYDYDKEIDGLKDLSLTEKEAEYLRTLGMFTEEYIQFLSNKPMKGVMITHSYANDNLYTPCPVASGEWCRAMLYEIFCLSVGNEMYTASYCQRHMIDPKAVWETADARLMRKIRQLRDYNKPLNLVEFGTRRRMSKRWQRHMLVRLFDAHLVFGTSNVQFAMETGIPVKGTFGHEFVMGMQGIYPVAHSQKKAFELWASHWQGKLAIALDDTLGEAKFLRDFTPDLMAAYDGLRHDSGCPIEWSESRIRMFERAGFDMKTKTLFYSDGLTVDAAISLDRKFGNKAKTGFGIGTHLSNDSFTPVPQAVMKIVDCNGLPVAKLSNNPEKASCLDPKYLEYVKHISA